MKPKLTPEVVAWWRKIIRPIFFVMFDKGIAEIHIVRTKNKVKFTLIPDKEK